MDERADIYSLGVIVAEMMTQVAPPFERYDLMDGLRNRFPGLNWERESRVIEVVIRSSAKNPDRRYGSVRELMETWQELLPALSAPVGIAEPSWSRGLRELTATDFEALARVVSGDLTQADYRGYKDEDHGDFTILMKLVEMGLVCGSEQHGEMSDGDPAGGIYSVVPTHAGRALCTALSALGDNWSQIGQFLGSSRTEKAEL